MPEDPKPTPEPEKPVEAPPAPAGPTNEQLAAGIREANIRAMAAERAAMIAAGANRPPQPTPVDPLDKWSQEDIVMNPEEKKRLLGNAISQRARAETADLEARMEQRMAFERQAMANQNAIDMVIAQRPELTDPKNSSSFGAALTKVKMDADAAGQQLSPAQMATRALQTYDEVFRKNTNSPMPPRLEGGNRADLSQLPGGIEIVTHQSMLEKKYGLKKGSVKEMYDSNDGAAIDGLNRDYLQAKNGPLFKRGALSNIDAIRATMDSPETES
jgi:hypothetical protein